MLEPAEKEVKLPKYEKWPGYENNLQFVTRRYCGLWGAAPERSVFLPGTTAEAHSRPFSFPPLDPHILAAPGLR